MKELNKYQQKAQDERIATAVIKSKTTKELQDARFFIDQLLKLRKTSKLKTTYVTGTKNAIKYNGEDKVYFDFKFDSTVTGRMSCSGYKAGPMKPKGVSFHTLPNPDEDDEGVDVSRNIRSSFCAPKGTHAFITADYSTMELRILSFIAGEGAMKLAFYEGKDLHTYTASLLFKCREDQVDKKQRKIAKTINFLIVYGGGAPNLSQVAGISIPEAEKIIQRYGKVFPRVFSYMKVVEDQVKSLGYVTTLFGRKRHLPNVNSPDLKVVNRAVRQALNFTVQSPASDVMLCAVDGITDSFVELGMSSRLVATVHDSVEVVSPYEESLRAIYSIRKNMMNPPALSELGIEFDVPLVVDIEIGHNFGLCTGVKFDENGIITNQEEILEYIK